MYVSCEHARCHHRSGSYMYVFVAIDMYIAVKKSCAHVRLPISWLLSFCSCCGWVCGDTGWSWLMWWASYSECQHQFPSTWPYSLQTTDSQVSTTMSSESLPSCETLKQKYLQHSYSMSSTILASYSHDSSSPTAATVHKHTHNHSIVNSSSINDGLYTTRNKLPSQKWRPHTHRKEDRNGPSSANQGCSKAKPMLSQPSAATSPLPTLSSAAEPMSKGLCQNCHKLKIWQKS